MHLHVQPHVDYIKTAFSSTWERQKWSPTIQFSYFFIKTYSTYLFFLNRFGFISCLIILTSPHFAWHRDLQLSSLHLSTLNSPESTDRHLSLLLSAPFVIYYSYSFASFPSLSFIINISWALSFLHFSSCWESFL